MTSFQLKKIAIALSLSAAISAHAAGLGTMISSSKLGEPLNAEIELLAVTPSELSGIQATLASDQVYQEQLLEKPASYAYIQIAIGNNSKGEPVLKLSSTQPITEAFLDMLIQVDWPTGRLVKEYTLLLDPPGYNSNSVAEAVTLPVSPETAANTSAKTVPLPQSPVAPMADKPVVSPTPASKPAVVAKKANPSNSDEESALGHETVQGDTLYAIARKMKPQGVTVEQMLVSLYQANPEAFDGQNMNRLKVGKILKAPDPTTVEKVSQQQARSVLATHIADWHVYKNTLANAVTHTQAKSSSEQAAGKIAAAGKKTPPASASKDVLKLSAGDEKSTAKGDKAGQKGAQEKLTAQQEDKTAKNNAIKDERSRSADLEKQVNDMKKLLALKNDAMTKAQQNAAVMQTKPSEAKATETTQAKPAAEAKHEETKSEATSQVAPEPVAKTSPEASPETAVAAEEPQQVSFILSLINRLKAANPALPFALVALPLLACIWFMMRMRRKKQIHAFEDAIVTSPATQTDNNTVFGNTQVVNGGDTSFLTDFSQSPVGGVIDAHDVDPIAEAEVYMAYGRDAQAEEILKDAIAKDPKRQELKLKLLEIYQNSANIAAFESLASDVYTKSEPQDPIWAKVVQMGNKLDPANPLYRMQEVGDAQISDAPVELSAPKVADENDESGYHLNFEAPPLAFESPSTANAANAKSTEVVDIVEPVASDENVIISGLDSLESTESVNNSPAVSIRLAESEVNQEAIASNTSQSLESNLNQPKPLELKSAEAEKTELEAFSLRVESTPDSPIAPAMQSNVDANIPVIEEVSAALDALEAEVEATAVDSSLTPKALDLPTLDLDMADTSKTQTVTTTPLIAEKASLSTDDAVFDSIPDLSFELGTSLAKSDTETAIDFDTLNVASKVATPAINQESPPIEFLPDISLELGGKADSSGDTLTESESEEVDTKLDLIKAYIDMEDMIGAKELIEEVMQEGGESQRKRASELWAKIS